MRVSLLVLLQAVATTLASTSSTNLTCHNASDCYSLAETLQVTGTQETFVESTVVLYDALQQWNDDYKLWSSHGKLNLFYTMHWQIAKDAIDKSLELEGSATNLNSFLFAGWLYSTMQYRDVDTAATYFERAIDLIPTSDNPSNFWPYFEYAVFQSHIAEDFEESQRLFELAVNASSLQNPFIAFFYGLLLEYHPMEVDVGELNGEDLIQSAIQAGSNLPGQAAWNMVFQALLLDSMNRVPEAKRCCEFSAAILDKNVSNWYLFCPNINDHNDDPLASDGDNDSSDDDSGGIVVVSLGRPLNVMAWIGLLAVGMFML